MEIKGEENFAHPCEVVWDALIDPEALAACVPGCNAFERLSENRYQAQMKAEIGPVSASFSVEICIVDPQPPNAYRLEGSAKSPVGFGRGAADVRLAEDGAGGTLLSYTANLSLGGKLAQVGARLLSGITRKIVAHFFRRLAGILDGRHPAAARLEEPGAVKIWIWVIGPRLWWTILVIVAILGGAATYWMLKALLSAAA